MRSWEVKKHRWSCFLLSMFSSLSSLSFKEIELHFRIQQLFWTLKWPTKGSSHFITPNVSITVNQFERSKTLLIITNLKCYSMNPQYHIAFYENFILIYSCVSSANACIWYNNRRVFNIDPCGTSIAWVGEYDSLCSMFFHTWLWTKIFTDIVNRCENSK